MEHKELVDLINKEFGSDTIVTKANKNINVIPTGCIPLDIALGVGGIPTGRITEFYGNESSGKTTIALQTVRMAQRMDMNVVYIDAEHAIDTTYAVALGIDLDKTALIQPDTAEQALQIIHNLFAKYSDNLGLVVLDSVAALVPSAEADSEVGDANVGLMARLLSGFLRRISPGLHKSSGALLLINQVRANISGARSFAASTKTTPGGYALRHAASVRAEFARIGNVTAQNNVDGIKAKATVRKNKVAPPYKVADYNIMFAQGTPILPQVIDLATSQKIIKRAGSWYKHGDESIGQNHASVVDYIITNNLQEQIFYTALRNSGLPEKSLDIYIKYLDGVLDLQING